MIPLRQNSIRLAVLIFAAASCADGFAAGDRPVSPEQLTFFEQKVRPLLVERCYACHSPEKQVKGGLRLDTRDGWVKGGYSGPAIEPGKLDDSLLIQAIRYLDADLKMPPAGKLPPAEIAILEAWVRDGAADPRDAAEMKAKPVRNLAAERTHWAYQPLQKAAAPAIRGTTWPLNDIDRFVLATLESKGLQPALDAERTTWLRRVSLDLTGLPPTPDEIIEFLQDATPDAWERVVDRLLASPAFGERWARSWLDLVGYADQIGSANNVPAESAWRYRDYVVRAYQADKPFDEFVREQVAGDLLSADSIPQRRDQLTATGFLVLGNVNIVEADKLVMKMDLVDQQVEKLGKTFLGMTLNCVRCHDHKFDPITVRDYYGLAGIFASTESTYKTERGLWSSVTRVPLPETLAEFTRRSDALRAHDQQVAAVSNERIAAGERQRELELLIKSAKEAAANPPAGGAVTGATTGPAGGKSLAELEKEAADLSASLKKLDQRQWHLNYLQPAPPLALGVKDGYDIADARTQVRGNPHVLGPQVPRGFVDVATHGPTPVVGPQQSGRLQLAEWLTHAASPLMSRVTVNRLWQRIFGRGLVESVDYFGVRGAVPTHPELLDALARDFIAGGWSQKRMLRQMVLSRTYRQRSEIGTEARTALEIDPDNHFLWRMSARRLEAEMLRDAVLAVSGGLEPFSGGPALAPEFVENVGGLNPKDVNPISFSLTKFRDNQSRIRTIYLPVVRSSEQRGPADVLNFFDFTLPARLSGDRPTTAVASQALFLLNGPLLSDAAQRLAAGAADSPATDDEQRIAALYLRILNRSPTVEETAAALQFLSATTETPRRDAWQQWIQALLASNEFLFRL